MLDRIADDPGFPKHEAAGHYFNRLILDLKKQLLGYPHDPVTMKRLEEGTQYVLDLDRCRERAKVY